MYSTPTEVINVWVLICMKKAVFRWFQSAVTWRNHILRYQSEASESVNINVNSRGASKSRSTAIWRGWSEKNFDMHGVTHLKTKLKAFLISYKMKQLCDFLYSYTVFWSLQFKFKGFQILGLSVNYQIWQQWVRCMIYLPAAELCSGFRNQAQVKFTA